MTTLPSPVRDISRGPATSSEDSMSDGDSEQMSSAKDYGEDIVLPYRLSEEGSYFLIIESDDAATHARDINAYSMDSVNLQVAAEN